jgi:periplasmic copper chaperone A
MPLTPSTTKTIAVYAAITWTTAVMCPYAAAQSANQVKIDNAWVRATVPGQQGTGGFMTLSSTQALRLVAISSPAAATAEVHEMRMQGDVMQMRALPDGVALPAGQALELKPGSAHIMLMQIKQVLKPDTRIPLTLTFSDARGKRSRVTVQVPVALQAPAVSHSRATALPPVATDASQSKP